MTIDLQQFCGRDKCRSYLTAPFSFGEFTYATNGHVAVRVLRREDVGEVAGAPESVIGLFEETVAGHGAAHPIPAIPQPEMMNCRPCNGCGKVIPCPECEGEGSRECDLGHDHDCEDCGGSGEISALYVKEGEPGFDQIEVCSNCDGGGRRPKAYPGWAVPVVFPGGHGIGLGYANKIAKLPGVVWNLDGDQEKPAPFWFDGGVGLVMRTRFTPGSELNIVIGEPAEVVA